MLSNVPPTPVQSTHDLDVVVQPNGDVQMQPHPQLNFSHTHLQENHHLDIDDLVISEPGHMISEPNCMIRMVDHMISIVDFIIYRLDQVIKAAHLLTTLLEFRREVVQEQNSKSSHD